MGNKGIPDQPQKTKDYLKEEKTRLNIAWCKISNLKFLILLKYVSQGMSKTLFF